MVRRFANVAIISEDSGNFSDLECIDCWIYLQSCNWTVWVPFACATAFLAKNNISLERIINVFHRFAESRKEKVLKKLV